MNARTRFASRKFWLAEQALVMGFILSIMEKLNPTFGTIASLVVTAYIGVNGFVESRRIQANGGET